MKGVELVPQQIDEYKIVSLLGEGSTGKVYLAEKDGSHFALKLLERGNIQELVSEFFILKGLKHPKIVNVYSVNLKDDGAYAVLEYAEGGSLQGKYFKKNWREFVERVVKDILPTLGFLHQRGILHGDIKPSNILITSEGTYKLSDFGGIQKFLDLYLLAKAETLTLDYTAPEILRGERATTQSDLYSLGILMYEVLTGKLPFEGSVEMVVNGHLMGIVNPPHHINPEIPESLSNFIVKMLEKSPVRRPANAEEVRSILSKILENKSYQPEWSDFSVFVGRGKELRIAESLFKRVIEGGKKRNNVLIFYGPEGIGKSTLADEIVSRAYLQGIFTIKFDLKSDNYSASLKRLGKFLENFVNQKLPEIGNSNLRQQFVSNIYNTLKILSNKFPVLIVIDEFPSDDHISWQIFSDISKLIKRDRIGIVVFSQDIVRSYIKGVNNIYRLNPFGPVVVRELLKDKKLNLSKSDISRIYRISRGLPSRLTKILNCLSKNKKIDECLEECKALSVDIGSLPNTEREILKFMVLMGNPVNLNLLIDIFGIEKVTQAVNALLARGILRRLNYYSLNSAVRDKLLTDFVHDRSAIFLVAGKFSKLKNYRRAARVLYDTGYFSSSFRYIEHSLKRSFKRRNYIKLYDLLRLYEDVNLTGGALRKFLSYYVYTLINLGMYRKALNVIEDNYDYMIKSEADFLRCCALKELGYPIDKLISLMETNVRGQISGFLKDDADSLYVELISETNISQDKFDSIVEEILKRRKRPDVRVKLLRISGNYFYNRRDYRRAKSYYREGLRLARKKDVHWEIPNLLMNLAVSRLMLGEIKLDKYLENLKNAARLAEKQANYPILEKIYLNLSFYYMSFNQFSEAESSLENLKQLGELSDNPSIIAKYYENIAYLNFERGIWDNVEEYYMKAYENYRKVGVPDIGFYGKYIKFLIHLGNFSMAIHLLREALSYWKKVSSEKMLAWVYENLFIVLGITGRRNLMEKFLIRVPESIRNEPGISYFISFGKKDFRTALKVVNEIIEQLEPYGESFQVRYFLEKAESLLSLGEVDEAYQFIKIYLYKKPEGPFREALGYFVLAKVYLAKRDWSNALLNFERARRMFEQLGAKYQLGKTKCFIAFVGAIYREHEPDESELKMCKNILNSVGAGRTFDEIKLEIMALLEK